MRTFFLSLVAVLAATFCRADIDRTHAPAAGPEPSASFPDFQQEKLSNGLKVFIVENHREPTVTFRLLIKAGDVFDGDKPGLSDAVAINSTKARPDAPPPGSPRRRTSSAPPSKRLPLATIWRSRPLASCVICRSCSTSFRTLFCTRPSPKTS